MKLSSILHLLLVGLTVRLPTTIAHPGAVANDRATCGTEYSTSAQAYNIPDIQDAWYLRRIATCANPVFWSTFDIVEESEQEVYIAVISPEIERFEDELEFHAIWYGPGLEAGQEGLSEIPTILPEGIEVDEQLAMMGAGYIKSPERFDDCGFVDTNKVMKRFSDVINGRCMEDFSFPSDFADPLQQDASSVMSWWLYSFNHLAADPGTYYLQTWLTRRDDQTNTAQGKYEITLGPHSWRGYATDSTLDLAQSQGTSCTCAVNAWDYKETYLERLGDLPIEFEAAQLPGGSCSADNAPTSPCETIPQEQYMSDGSAVEWSGLFDLQPGKPYEWTFRAYYQGAEAEEYGYPDPGMFVYLTPSNNVSSVALESNDILTATVENVENAETTISTIISSILTAFSIEKEEDILLNVVTEGETISMDTVQFIEFTDPAEAKSTTVLIQPEFGASTIAVFTQHVPSEFMAHALRDVETGEYIFPINPTLYR